MSRAQSNPNGQDPRRERVEELLLDRAVGGLDAGEHAELELLCAQLGMDPDDLSFDLAAAAATVAMTPAQQMPASLRAKVLGATVAMDAGVSDVERRELKLVGDGPSGRPAPTRLQLMTYKVMAYSGWMAAAACLGLASVAYFGRGGATTVSPPTLLTVGAAPVLDPATKALATLERIMRSEGSRAIVASLTDADDSAGPPAPVGQVVWSGEHNEGVLCLANLPPIENPGDAYQLWVVDALRDERYPVDAGTFNIDPGKRQGMVYFSAKLPVAYPRAFAITIERAGGNVVSTQPPVALAPVASESPAETINGPTATFKVAQPLDEQPREEMSPPEP